MQQLAWHPWTGCSPISPSCLNCYAVPAADKEPDLVHETGRGPVWNGKLRRNLGDLDLPARTPGRAYFQVCPHGDLFHENAPTDWIDDAFDVMEAARQHVFVVMTKRADRLLEYTQARYAPRRAPAHIAFGVGVERQQEANQRIPPLMGAPLTMKYLTVYALLGPLDIGAIPGVPKGHLAALRQVQIGDGWLTRSADPAWAQKVSDDFTALRVPVSHHDLLADAAARGY